MFFVGRLMNKFDIRLILAVGLGLSAFSTWQMSHFALNMGAGPVIVSGLLQGVGTGLVFVPLSTIGFATLDPRLRGDAAALYTLLRNLGSSAGISILQYVLTRNTEVVRSGLAPHLRPDNPVVRAAIPSGDFTSLSGLETLSGELNRQAAMVAYVDDFHLMLMMTIFILPLLLLMKGRSRRAAAAASAPDLEAQGAH